MIKKTLIILSLFFIILPVFSRDLPDFEHFFSILSRLESSGNAKAYNKHENAIGIVQIRPDYFKDARDFDKNLLKYTHNDCFDPEISKLVVKAYLSRYCKNNYSFEHWAKIHNGGGQYYLNKNKKYQENLDKYWNKFSRLNKQK